jgi:hypothetical protein
MYILAPLSSHIIAFAKQYREYELRTAKQSRATSWLKKRC